MSIKNIKPMGFQLHVLDPYIVAFHHYDEFPKGNGSLAPVEMPVGKNNGQDFDMNASWRMYHGDTVPGFPAHPHRGFETITVVTEGYADHFDSKGSKGRFGGGDVQWMTAGKGVQHSEMFPLINTDKGNTMELFQIWLNLPSKSKFVEPAYKMLWNEDIPVITEKNKEGKVASIKLIAGEYKGVKSLDPAPDSWAFDRNNHVGVWIVKLEPNAEFTIPAVSKTLNRMLYNIKGGAVTIADNMVANKYYAELDGGADILVKNGNEPTELLLLEGEPMNEPVVAQGPFVLNTVGELKQAFMDYQETEFGGWQWETTDPVNESGAGRFAYHNNGEKVEYPEGKYNL